MNGFTVSGDQVLMALGVCLVIVLIAVAGRVLLAAAVIAGIQWLVIHYLASNVTLVWVALGVPALLAGYTLADALTGSIGLGSSFRKRRGGGRR
jgi:hypothetical protein